MVFAQGLTLDSSATSLVPDGTGSILGELTVPTNHYKALSVRGTAGTKKTWPNSRTRLYTEEYYATEVRRTSS